jgi:dihydroflavonol-4-reductase
MEETTMKNTLYLLTGAAGFLGSSVCNQLLERGDKVRAFVLPGDKSVKYIPGEVELCEGDLCDPSAVDSFFTIPAGMESIVIHCASMVTVNPDFNQKLVDVNVGGTQNIIEACFNHTECKKLVYVSSTGAIPEAPKGQKISEVNQFDPDKVVGWYSRTKAMASQAVLDAVRQRGLNACIVHPSGILGPNDYAVGEVTKTVIQIVNGEMPVGMQGSFNLCDVRDLAYGCIMAADKGRRGECYILGNEEVTLKALCQMLHNDLGCKSIRFYLPLGIAAFIAKRMERKAKKTGKQPIMTSFSVYHLARNNTFDYSKAKKELGYKTRPYAETLHDEAQWLKQEGKITAIA